MRFYEIFLSKAKPSLEYERASKEYKLLKKQEESDNIYQVDWLTCFIQIYKFVYLINYWRDFWKGQNRDNFNKKDILV